MLSLRDMHTLHIIIIKYETRQIQFVRIYIVYGMS